MTPNDQTSTSAPQSEKVATTKGWYRLTGTLILFTLEHFRRRISCCTAKRFHQCAPVKLPRKAKIAQFDATALVEENVLEFEIAMDDAFVVEVGDGQAELAEHNFGLVLRQSALLHEVVKELSARAELGDNPDGRLGGDDFVHLGDIGMV